MHIINAYGLTYFMVKKIESLVDLVEWDELEIKYDFIEDFPHYVPVNDSSDNLADEEVPLHMLRQVPEANFIHFNSMVNQEFYEPLEAQMDALALDEFEAEGFDG